MATEPSRTDTVGNFRFWAVTGYSTEFSRHISFDESKHSTDKHPLSTYEYIIYEA